MAYTTNAEGNYFFQERLSDPFTWLTCTGVGDVEIPEGDRTPVYCPDPANSGQFMIEGFVRGDKGALTYALTKPLSSVYNFLLETLCGHYGRINWVCRGHRQDVSNYEVAMILANAEASRRGLGNPVREPEGTESRVNTTLDMQAIDFTMLYHLTIARQGVLNVADANSIYFLPQHCEDRCGEARGLCEEGIMGLDRAAGYAYDAEVKKTHDYGATWTQTAVDPFAYGGDIGPVLTLETLAGYRYLVWRSTEVGGAPAECAYSDDLGETWTNQFISALNNQAVFGMALRGADIYVCGSDGFIWKSATQGSSWTTEEAGVETILNLNAICFHKGDKGFAVGNDNAFLFLESQSNNWALKLGPVPAGVVNLLSVAVNAGGQVFVGTSDARLFRSDDDGDTWVEVLDLVVGTIDWLSFDPKLNYVGGLIYNPAAPGGAFYRSEDGGATWQLQPNMPVNAGLNGGFMCDANHIWLVGNDQGGTTFIAYVQPTAI